MKKKPIALSTARARAMVIEKELRSLCEKIAIAGSVRRADVEFCGDLDIVVLGPTPAFWQRLEQHTECLECGTRNRTYRMADGWEIGVYIAQHEQRNLLGEIEQTSNWGTLLICRTGPQAHNIRLAQRARWLGLKWNPYQGVFSNGRCLASAEETDIYDALKMNFILPHLRATWVTWAEG